MATKNFCEICGLQDNTSFLDGLKLPDNKPNDKLTFVNHRLGVLCEKCVDIVVNEERTKKIEELFKNGK